MHEPGAVRRVERPGDLTHERRDLGRGEGAALGDDVAKRAAAHILHDDERVAPVLALVEDGDHMGMAHRRGTSRLGREPLPERGVGLRAEQLHRDVAVEPLVTGAPDLGRAAAVDPLEEPVAIREDPRFWDHVVLHRKFRAAGRFALRGPYPWARATSAASASS